MKTLDASHLLAEQLSPAELQALLPCDADARFDGHVTHGKTILVLALLVGGIELAGCLDDCKTVTELLAAFSHFASLWSGGVISSDQWSDAADCALAEIENFTVAHAKSMGDEIASINRAFSQAELN